MCDFMTNLCRGLFTKDNSYEEDEPTKKVADGSIVTAEDIIQQVVLFCTFEERCLLRTLNKTWKNAIDSLLLQTALEQVPLFANNNEGHSIRLDRDIIPGWQIENVFAFAEKQCKGMEHFEKVENLFPRDFAFAVAEKQCQGMNHDIFPRYFDTNVRVIDDDNGDEVWHFATYEDPLQQQLLLWIRKSKEFQWLEYERKEIDLAEAQTLQRIAFGLQRNGGKLVHAWFVTCQLITCEANDREEHTELKGFHILLFHLTDGNEVEMIVHRSYEETYSI